MSTNEGAYETNDDARRALNWGLATWIANGAGCLISMVPLALPLGVLATIATLVSGVGAMVWGVRGRRRALREDDERSARDARIGFWLGAAHMIIVALVVGAIALAVHVDALEGARVLGR
jgi:uncharacterized membrane protein SpoIIM required for sporulation